MSNHNIPYQVQQLIDSMLNSKENIHLRGNYRLRLNEVRIALDAAIRKYDNEVLTQETLKPKRKRA